MNIKLKDMDAVKFNGIDIGAVKFNGEYVWRKGSVVVLRHNAGTFSAFANGAGIKWRYKDNEVMTKSCNFKIDESDNNVYLLFDKELSKFTCNRDNNLLLDLSDLQGKITNTLNLSGCSNITGSLSDLQGKITNTLNLNNCSNITGSLSDLQGNNTRYLDLSSCVNITGSLSDLQGKITHLLSLYNCSNITGSLSDLQGKITYQLDLYNCSNITGSLSDLQGKITNTLNLSGCSNITGSLSDLQGKITNTLNLSGCSNITGSLSDLQGKITNTLSLANCSNITGIYYGTSYPRIVNLSNTGISPTDMDTNLINFNNSGKKNGAFTASGMSRTSASDTAVEELTARGWKITGLTKVERTVI